MAAISKEELEELIEELGNYKGRHTELVSVYVPAGNDLMTAQRQLEAEKSTAKNIKSTSTRKNVIDALDKIIRMIKDYKKNPDNGLALFAGNISEVEGQVDLQSWEIEPPTPLRSRLYRCDKDFVLEPLREIVQIKEVFGLLVMDRKEATIGLLEGKRIEVLHKMTSGVPSRVKAGGQSAQRFHRITEGLTKVFYTRIGEQMKKIFFDMTRLKGIIIGGPVPTKDEFLDGDYLPTKLKGMVIGVRDIGDSDESGLKELVQKSQDILSSQDIIREKKLLEKFFEKLGENPDMVVYDEAGIRKALEYGAVNTLILSKDINKTTFIELKKLANAISAEFHIVSTDTPEGEQFMNLSGMGAILRYKF
ncbi:peptide chain release factor aRF-1 [Candidatus Pacearchaeota archaeon]|nr:peptide chain release factor aRF-1 [Candidatus Pacearchaeota archaeon]